MVRPLGRHRRYEQGDIDSRLAGSAPNLTADLPELHRRAPHARIILITYPKLFPDPPTRQREWPPLRRSPAR